MVVFPVTKSGYRMPQQQQLLGMWTDVVDMLQIAGLVCGQCNQQSK
jgi:hypothetical protein